MRWLLAIVVFGAQAAAADPKPVDLSITCPKAPAWDTFVRCLEQRGDVFIVHDLPDAKLVGYTLKPESTRLELYTLADGTWTMRWSTNTHPTLELLNFGTYKQDSFRIDLGTASETVIRLDGALPLQPAVIKRINTTLCSRRGVCRSIVTSCDVLVRGRSQLWFRGRPVWDGQKLMVYGDTSNTGIQCRVSKILLTSEEP